MEKWASPSSVDAEEEYEFLEIGFVEQAPAVDLSNWVFVDASDADSEEHRRFDEEEDDDDDDDDDEEPEGQREEDGGDDGGNGSVPFVSAIPLPVPRGPDQIEGHRGGHFLYDSGDLKFWDYDHYEEEEEEEEDEEDYDDGYDLNDELVPWSVSDRFGGRQRMRKLGKRTFTKMNHSKRSPKLFVKPGCVRGKHGLGLKHNC